MVAIRYVNMKEKGKCCAREDDSPTSETWEDCGQISLVKVSIEITLPLTVWRKRLFQFYRALYFTNTEQWLSRPKGMTQSRSFLQNLSNQSPLELVLIGSD
jgi:hypothetical protein